MDSKRHLLQAIAVEFQLKTMAFGKSTSNQSDCISTLLKRLESQSSYKQQRKSALRTSTQQKLSVAKNLWQPAKTLSSEWKRPVQPPTTRQHGNKQNTVENQRTFYNYHTKRSVHRTSAPPKKEATLYQTIQTAKENCLNSTRKQVFTRDCEQRLGTRAKEKSLEKRGNFKGQQVARGIGKNSLGLRAKKMIVEAKKVQVCYPFIIKQRIFKYLCWFIDSSINLFLIQVMNKFHEVN